MSKITVLGAGSWGTVFAQIVADAGNLVTLWGRDVAVVEGINVSHRNFRYLPAVELSGNIISTVDLEKALLDCEIVFYALPAQLLRQHLLRWGGLLGENTVVVSLMKGFEQKTCLRMSEVFVEVTKVVAPKIAVLSGPNLSKEIAAKKPTACVVASVDQKTAMQVAKCCTNSYFKPYVSGDVVGVEVGGIVKNIVAIAVGIFSGQNFGDNAKASMLTRGLAEATRLAVALGGNAATLAGLAGLGDMVATCSSVLSRNHMVGVLLGEGYSLQEILVKTGQTAEGVSSSEAILQVAKKFGVLMPITEHVVALLQGKVSLEKFTQTLWSSSPVVE